jgi:hypothetical protein
MVLNVSTFQWGLERGKDLGETAIRQSHRHGTEQQPTLQPDANVQHGSPCVR